MMEQKKLRTALVVCLVLFVAGCLLSGLLSKIDANEWGDSESGQIIISEVLSSNRTYPTPDGQFLDFIEVHNLSANAADISGFMLSDDLNSIGYTFPDGTVLPPYGYIVCWCNPDVEDDRYAGFGISREGGETVYLYNSANVLVDQVAVPYCQVNVPLIRTAADSWIEAQQASPGFANTEEGFRQWLTTVTGGDIRVTITEVMTDNSCVTATAGKQPHDWVELTNDGNTKADLSGAYLSNDPADPLKWQIPRLVLEAGQSAVIYCTGSRSTADEAPFGLSKTGCTVMLTSKLGDLLSQVECPDLLTDHTWALSSDGSYSLTERPTPGFANTEEGFFAWLDAVGATQMHVSITEVMTSNRSTVLNAAGELCDWVELTNLGASSADLTGAYLSDDPEDRGKWRIGNLVLEAGQSAVIPCVGQFAGEGEADFKLDSAGCTVILSGSAGNLLDQVDCPRLDDDRAWARQEDGTYQQTVSATPGMGNTEDNAMLYRASQTPQGSVSITEVMAANDRYFIQSDGEYYDWIELTNISDSVVELSDYRISDDPDDLDAFTLPERKLEPGEQVVILCSARNDLVGNYIHAPFTLSAEECWVYLTHSDGSFSDYLAVRGVPDGCSMGRTQDGIYYFTQPTPGRPNDSGTALIAQPPSIVTESGIYNNVSSLSVVLEGTGTVHYTTDGSYPTQEDPVYTAPLVLENTTILRAVNFEEDKLPSKAVTADYVINEGHTLPVMNLTADPMQLAELMGQTAPFDAEIPCHISLFEDTGGFSIDCGVELMATNTAYPEKKSLKVNFRGRYGSAVLGYPVFGEAVPPVFEALCLQAGSEHGLTMFRDELFTELCLQMTSAVPARHYKFCVLYVNGEYYGIYSLREDIDEMLYAQQNAVAAADVTMVEEPAPWSSDLYLLAQYCKENDLSDPECFKYLSDRMDIASLIDWMILEGYCGNDSIANDLRYFRTPEAGNNWQLGFFDLDGGFTSRTGFENVLNKEQPHQYLTFTRAIAENATARQQFLDRLEQVLNGTLSKEHVLFFIEEFEKLLSPEIQRERARWGGDTATWQADVDRLKTYLTRYDHTDLLLQSLRQHMSLTDEEATALTGG